MTPSLKVSLRTKRGIEKGISKGKRRKLVEPTVSFKKIKPYSK